MNARAMTLTSVVSLGALGAFASCATNADSGPPADEHPSVVPDASAGEDVVPPPVDAGCDASDPGCTTELVSCDEVDWCLVPTGTSPLHALTAVWGTSKDDVWAVGSGGTILHWDGSAWTPTPTGLQNTFFAIWGSGPNDVWAVSSTQVVLHSTGFQNGAAVWENRPTGLGAPTAAILRAVWGSSASDVRIGGHSFGMFDPAVGVLTADQLVKTDAPDGGLAWRPLLGGHTITSIWGSSASDVWMTADNGAAVPWQRGMTLHGTASDGGVDAGPFGDRLTWATVDSQSSVTLESVWGSSANDVWAVGALGTIRHVTEADIRWQEVVSPTTETLHAIWGSGPSDIWAVGDSGTILHYDGTSFQPSAAQLPLGKKPSLRGVWGSGPNDVWIVGDVVLHFTGPKAGRK